MSDSKKSPRKPSPLMTGHSERSLSSTVRPVGYDRWTAAPLTVPEPGRVSDEREFLRLPKNGQLDAIFSLSRSTWNTLILPCKANNFHPPIKSISLRRPGTIRGVRLIVVASAREYFERLIEEVGNETNRHVEEK